MNESVHDTCPACGAVVQVPMTGQWVFCQVCREGKLRWTLDPASPTHRLLSQAERQRLERLREELTELDRWVVEGLPGAAKVAEQIKSLLLKMAGGG